jgi:hypothetical protein
MRWRLEKGAPSSPRSSPRAGQYDVQGPGAAEIINARQRNGPVGTTKLTFLRRWTKFDNLAPERMRSEYRSPRAHATRLA